MRPSVILVTDPKWSVDRVCEVIARCELGPRLMVQLRDKANPNLLPVAVRLREATRRAGALFVVNGALEVARASGADGVHGLVEPAMWSSLPAHADADVSVAAKRGASAVLVSPIFDTPNKGAPRGVSALENAVRLRTGMLVYALGGVDAARADACAKSGADGVAVMRCLLDADDVRDIAGRLDAPFLKV